MPGLLLTLAIAVLQWLVFQLPFIYPQFDPTSVLFGSIESLVVLALYHSAHKYIKF